MCIRDRHCNFVTVPSILDEHLINYLREKSVFKDWPLEAIIPGREAFFAFLQEQWRRFLESTARGETVSYTHLDVYKRQGPVGKERLPRLGAGPGRGYPCSGKRIILDNRGRHTQPGEADLHRRRGPNR